MASRDGCCSCCKLCCYSTPYGTIVSLSITVVGLVGFLSSSVYGVVLINSTPSLDSYTVTFASIIGGMASTTIIPLLFATVLAYCVTGYVRDELYHPFVKKCVGPTCTVLIMVTTFVYFLLWLAMTVVQSLLMALYLELKEACGPIDQPGDCYTLNEGGVQLTLCGDLGDLCSEGLRVGLSLSISMGFSILVVIGLVLILIVQSANLIGVRESNKRSYRPGGDY